MIRNTLHPADFMTPRLFRHALVFVTLVLTGVLVSTLPRSLDGFGLIAVLALTTLDLVLIRVTRGLAFTRGQSLDEREHAQRDHAYRVGFRWLGLAVVVLMVITFFSVIVTAEFSPPFPSNLNTGIAGRVLVAVTEVLFIVPTMVIAWDQEDGFGDAERADTSTRRRRVGLSLMWLVLPGIVALWALDVTVTPVQAATGNPNFTSMTFGEPTCHEFVGGRVVGGPFGATVGLEAGVCWNGKKASMAADPLLKRCNNDTSDDFASVAETCTTSIDSDGTLHYTVRARVAPLPFSIGTRIVTLKLEVARDGTVITHP